MSVRKLGYCISALMPAVTLTFDFHLPNFSLEAFSLGIKEISIVVIAFVFDPGRRCTTADQDFLIANFYYQWMKMRPDL